MRTTSGAVAVPHFRADSARSNNIMDGFQLAAESRIQELSPPSRRDERWRFADLKRANLAGLDRPQPVSLQVKGVKPGVTCLTLAEAIQRNGALVRRLLESVRGPLGSEYFMVRALRSELLNDACIWVDRDVVLEEPVILERVQSSGDGTGSAVTLLVVEKGASVSVLERIRGETGSAGNLVIASGMDVGAGGRVNYVVSQELPKSVNLVQCAHLELGRDASGEVALFNQGASWVRQEVMAFLREQGGNAKLLGLNLLEGTDLVDQHTRQRHSQAHGASDLLFKNAIFDEGRAIFGGLIQVEEGAHYTDAYQSCRNLLLSESAEANAMPGLEINADQVKCSHGATTGQIDPEELFYLKARGISEGPARQLITLGFANEVVERVSHPAIRETLGALVEERLRRRGSASRTV